MGSQYAGSESSHAAPGDEAGEAVDLLRRSRRRRRRPRARASSRRPTRRRGWATTNSDPQGGPVDDLDDARRRRSRTRTGSRATCRGSRGRRCPTAAAATPARGSRRRGPDPGPASRAPRASSPSRRPGNTGSRSARRPAARPPGCGRSPWRCHRRTAPGPRSATTAGHAAGTATSSLPVRSVVPSQASSAGDPPAPRRGDGPRDRGGPAAAGGLARRSCHRRPSRRQRSRRPRPAPGTRSRDGGPPSAPQPLLGAVVVTVLAPELGHLPSPGQISAPTIEEAAPTTRQPAATPPSRPTCS